MVPWAVAVRIDQPEDGDDVPASADLPAVGVPDAREAPRPDAPDPRDIAGRTERTLEHRAKVDAAYRAYAIDQGCASVEKIERELVTPAMRRIEAEDPDRHLAGLDHRLKGKDRIVEKVPKTTSESSNADLSTNQAFAKVKDAIRYTLPNTLIINYTEGVLNDIERLF